MPKKSEDSEFLHYSEYDLDTQWQEQAHTFHKYAEILAKRKLDYAESKAEFELTEAELSRAIRATPEQYGLSKTTEALIEATVKVQAKYQQSLREMNTAKYDEDIARAAVDALQHKKSALENAVILWSRDYFSTPKLPKDHNQVAIDKQQEITTQGRFDSTKRKLNQK